VGNYGHFIQELQEIFSKREGEGVGGWKNDLPHPAGTDPRASVPAMPCSHNQQLDISCHFFTLAGANPLASFWSLLQFTVLE
jgi:hypothetical protein